ncbi:MAG TPA: deoxyribose-phosphate aldolase [Terriglobales bacterium]|nr:deoxyribose-phosphate aldolase [Terriglobales bacterium]
MSAMWGAAAAQTNPLPFKDARELARLFDHTLVLRAEATREQIVQLCEEAAEHGFASVFVPPAYVAEAVSILHATPVRVGTTVGFPFGYEATTVKRFQAAEALRLGADELDMVMNIGALKSGDLALVERDIRSVVDLGHSADALVKVILETNLLTEEEKIAAAQRAVAAGADFVKTCTGLSGGATAEDVALLRRVVGRRAGVKASGGIRTVADVARMVEAGADRIGTSSAVAILREFLCGNASS